MHCDPCSVGPLSIWWTLRCACYDNAAVEFICRAEYSTAEGERESAVLCMHLSGKIRMAFLRKLACKCAVAGERIVALDHAVVGELLSIACQLVSSILVGVLCSHDQARRICVLAHVVAAAHLPAPRSSAACKYLLSRAHRPVTDQGGQQTTLYVSIIQGTLMAHSQGRAHFTLSTLLGCIYVTVSYGCIYIRCTGHAQATLDEFYWEC